MPDMEAMKAMMAGMGAPGLGGEDGDGGEGKGAGAGGEDKDEGEKAAADGRYHWQQKGEEIQVRFPSETALAKKDVLVKFKRGFLQVTVQGVTMLDGALRGTVGVDECTWCLAPGGTELQVMLTKQSEGDWASLMRHLKDMPARLRDEPRGQSDVIRSTLILHAGMLPVRQAPHLFYPGTTARTIVVPAGIATEGGQRKTSPTVIQAWQPRPLSSQGSYVGISQAAFRAPAVRQASSNVLPSSYFDGVLAATPLSHTPLATPRPTPYLTTRPSQQIISRQHSLASTVKHVSDNISDTVPGLTLQDSPQPLEGLPETPAVASRPEVTASDFSKLVGGSITMNPFASSLGGSQPQFAAFPSSSVISGELVAYQDAMRLVVPKAPGSLPSTPGAASPVRSPVSGQQQTTLECATFYEVWFDVFAGAEKAYLSDWCRQVLWNSCTLPPLPRLCALALAAEAFEAATTVKNSVNKPGLEACAAIDSTLASDGERWLSVAESLGNLSEYQELTSPETQTLVANKQVALDFNLESEARGWHKILSAQLYKLWTMTTKDEFEFRVAVAQMAPRCRQFCHSPQTCFCIPTADGPVQKVCVRGSTIYARESHCFVHFMWGHFGAVVVALARANLLGRKLRLVFTDHVFVCARSRYLLYYGLISDELPEYDPSCSDAPSIELTTPIEGHFGEPEVEASVTETVWREHLLACKVRGGITHPLASARLRLNLKPQSQRASEGLRFLWLRRGIVGAVARSDEPVRDIRNVAEVRQLLNAYATLHGGTVTETSFDGQAWHEQVAAVARADILLSFHGSQLMICGSRQVMPGGVCHCGFAYCGAANAEHGLIYVLATDSRSDCKMGSWAGRVLRANQTNNNNNYNNNNNNDADAMPFERPPLVWPSWDDWNSARHTGGRDFDARPLLRALSSESDALGAAARLRAFAAKNVGTAERRGANNNHNNNNNNSSNNNSNNNNHNNNNTKLGGGISWACGGYNLQITG
ncbi:unnamed protein product [Polarella glacialis]|uniref:CS domain-containing protein n=1 Tax=Polarella glacialis TaxID=89957 RepID=A0A813JLE0_POLGL|nr:unnamed protein product [Polarella glacialis]